MAEAHYNILFKNKLYYLLDSLGNQLQFSASIWGSFSRNAITPQCDIDIICYSEKLLPNILDIVESSLKNGISNSIRWDVDFIETDIWEYIKSNGTNYHSVFFSDKVLGFGSTTKLFEETRTKVRLNIDLSIRELFNLFCSYYGLASCISKNDSGYCKYSFYGTNKWTRLIQATQIRWNYLIGKSSIEVLTFLSNKLNIDLDLILKSYYVALQNRIDYESSKNDRYPYNTSNENLIWYELFNRFFKLISSEIQENSGVNNILFKKFLDKISPNNSIDVPKSNSENVFANIVLRSFLAERKNEFEEILSKYSNNWWAMSNLCINPNASSEIIKKIVFPEFEVNIKNWKTIRLYVAKNKNTDIETLKKILVTPGLREQDYVSAQANLKEKEYD